MAKMLQEVGQKRQPSLLVLGPGHVRPRLHVWGEWMTAVSAEGHASRLRPHGQEHRERKAVFKENLEGHGEEDDVTVTFWKATTEWGDPGEQQSRPNGCLGTMHFNGYLVDNQGWKQQKALWLLINLGCSIQPKNELRRSIYLDSDL